MKKQTRFFCTLSRAAISAAILSCFCPALWAGSFTTGNIVTRYPENATSPSTWANSTQVSIAYAQFSTGSLTINGGSDVVSDGATIGNLAKSNGSASIAGNGSTWNMSGGMTVGYIGKGSLAIRSGGLVANGNSAVFFYNATIGSSLGSDGSALITGVSGGTRSTWQHKILNVGYNSKNALLNIEDGGLVISHQSLIGREVGSDGTATISGYSGSFRSEWSNSSLTVGRDGKGSLRVVEGGLVRSSSYGYIGYGSKAAGSVFISGVKGGNRSTWTMVRELSTGSGGSGRMVVEDGGWVISGGGDIRGGGGPDNIKISGVSASNHRSTWEMSGALSVRKSASSVTAPTSLAIEQGGLVKSLRGSLNTSYYQDTGSAIVSVSGISKGFHSTWEISQNLSLESNCTLQINNGGLVSVGGKADPDGSGKIAFGIGDKGSGLLDVIGDVELNGLIEVSLLNAFVPKKGDSFTLIKSSQGTITGLSNAELLALLPTKGGTISWASNYASGGKEMTITAEAVPEPSSALLASLSLLGLGFLRRRSNGAITRS